MIDAVRPPSSQTVSEVSGTAAEYAMAIIRGVQYMLDIYRVSREIKMEIVQIAREGTKMGEPMVFGGADRGGKSGRRRPQDLSVRTVSRPFVVCRRLKRTELT
jgi:hypothetical protein